MNYFELKLKTAPVCDEAAPLLGVVGEGLAVAVLRLHAHPRALLLSHVAKSLINQTN